MSDWFCEYCQETSSPMDHGCNVVTLKSRLSHLSAVNEKLRKVVGTMHTILHALDGQGHYNGNLGSCLECKRQEALKLAAELETQTDEMGEK